MKKAQALFEIESVEMIEPPGKREDPDRAIKESRKRHKELVRLRGKKKHDVSNPERPIFMFCDNFKFSTWTKDDINLAHDLWGDENVTRYIISSGVLSPDEIRNRLETEIANQEQFGVQYWPFFDDAFNFIGCCGLRPYKKEKNVYELGFHLKSAYWGKGFASEVANSVVLNALYIRKVKALFAGHHPENKASAKILKNLGFIYSHDEFYPPTGLNHPTYVLKR